MDIGPSSLGGSCMSLHDQEQRDLFTTEVEFNCTVIAPAGVDKTQSIVTRIAHKARHTEAKEILPSLVVVTYTNRAALELQERVRAEIAANENNSEIIPAFNQAFFGTIHSFCLRLLNK